MASSITSCNEMEDLKTKGNTYFQKGNIEDAISMYSSGIDQCKKYWKRCSTQKETNNSDESSSLLVVSSLYPTLLSNRSMCFLKLYNNNNDNNDETTSSPRLYLEKCIQDCTEAMEFMDTGSTCSSSNKNNNNDKLRSKVLYRRAKARDEMVVDVDANTDTDTDTTANNELRNQAAQDLLLLLNIDPNNRPAATLLQSIRKKHSMTKIHQTPISKALLQISQYIQNNNNITNNTNNNNVETTTQQSSSLLQKKEEEESGWMLSLKVIMGSMAQDVSSASMELGRRNGVDLLFQVGVSSKQIQQKGRILALQILSAACSHPTFLLQYSQSIRISRLAQCIVDATADSCSTDDNTDPTTTTSWDWVAAAMALTFRLIVPWLQQETSNNSNSSMVLEGDSLCQMCIAALKSGDIKCQRASFDLLSAWTTTDFDGLVEAAHAADMFTDSKPNNNKNNSTTNNQKTEEELRAMKPREMAAYKKAQYEQSQYIQKRAKQNILQFCNSEGLSTLISCAIQTSNHSLRREFTSTLGRFISQLNEDEIKSLVGPYLGWDKKTKSKNKEEEKEDGGLTIEEILEEDEEEEKEEIIAVEEVSKEMMEEEEEDKQKKEQLRLERGFLTTSLLLGNGEVGTWALSEGWSNGKGVAEMTTLAESKDPKTMAIASEIVCAVASVEKARPCLSSLVESSTFINLLKSDDRDIRSGAAAAIAKLGLSRKQESSSSDDDEEGELFGLLEVAAGLLEEDPNNQEDLLLQAAATKANKFKKNASKKMDTSSTTTAVDRAIELLSYLSSKTLIKEEIAHGFKGNLQSSKTVMEQVVDLASQPNAGSQVYAYGISNIFASLAVSNEQLRKEAFEGKEITSEQYDQLQSLGKTEEEKEFAKQNMDEDPHTNVSVRIQKMAQAHVPRAMVKLNDGASDTTLEQLIIAMSRMAIEPTARGAMVQQGCLSVCIQMSKGKNPSEVQKKTMRTSQHCIAKLLVTTNPLLLTVSQRMGSIRPLIELIRDNDASDLQIFESLLAITNLASVGEETKQRIVAEKGIATLSYAMFSDHDMVRRAATEAMSNLLPHEEMLQHLEDPEKLKLWVAFATDYEENLECARAAAGCLAMATQYSSIANVLRTMTYFDDMVRTLIQCGNLELMHRVMVMLLNMADHGGKCKEVVLSTGSGQFCDGYVQSYHQGGVDLGFSETEKELMLITIDLAKQIAQKCT